MLGLEVADRRLASVAAHAQGIALGCRILRVHDVKGSRRVADLMGAILAARATASAAAASPRRNGSAPED
jgi:dihydropteroate synthase